MSVKIRGLTVPPLPSDLTGAALVGALNERLRQISLASVDTGGVTVTKTVKGSDGANYTLTYVDGVLTATTLP
jgi:tryptophan synthase alpha subunit